MRHVPYAMTKRFALFVSFAFALFLLSGCTSYGSRVYSVEIIPVEPSDRVYYVRRSVWDREGGSELLAKGIQPTGSQPVLVENGIAKARLPAWEWIAFGYSADGKQWYRTIPFVPGPSQTTSIRMFKD